MVHRSGLANGAASPVPAGTLPYRKGCNDDDDAAVDGGASAGLKELWRGEIRCQRLTTLEQRPTRDRGRSSLRVALRFWVRVGTSLEPSLPRLGREISTTDDHHGLRHGGEPQPEAAQQLWDVAVLHWDCSCGPPCLSQSAIFIDKDGMDTYDCFTRRGRTMVWPCRVESTLHRCRPT